MDRIARPKVTKELLERALAGEPRGARELFAILDRVFRWRIGMLLLPNGAVSRDYIRDICQETLVALLRDDGRLARSWDPSRASFETFSGLIATQKAIEFLRRHTEVLHTSIIEGLENCEGLEAAADSNRTPERLFASKELLHNILDILQVELSPKAYKLFVLLFIDELEVVEISVAMEMAEDAVYAWRSRLRRRIKEIADQIGGDV